MAVNLGELTLPDELPVRVFQGLPALLILPLPMPLLLVSGLLLKSTRRLASVMLMLPRSSTVSVWLLSPSDWALAKTL